MMKKLNAQRRLRLMAILCVLALFIAAGSTYAWFTFRAYTNITPMTGSVDGGDGSLLISNSASGPFDTNCNLIATQPGAGLKPLSTANLTSFYRVTLQDDNGMALSYGNVDKPADYLLSGSVYLRCTDNDFDIFLWRPSIDCGNDAQVLAALRLGLEIDYKGVKHTYIFKLDELGNTTSAAAKTTIPATGQVVSSIMGSSAVYTADPARSISEFTANSQADTGDITRGSNSLFALSNGEVAKVDYFLYLEGCDDNCINNAQNRAAALSLGFAGVRRSLNAAA